MNASRIRIIERPNMRKYGVIFEVEVNGVRLCRKDGSPRRFQTKEAAHRAAELHIATFPTA
jgi:hypothetical protein